jgi:hypothetical protein
MATLRHYTMAVSRTLSMPGRLKAILFVTSLVAMVLGSGAETHWGHA